MFYTPETGHGLPHNPFNAIVAPRPIGWISTRGADRHDNLAPYSFFNAVAYVPPQVMFASTSAKPDRDGTKDSVAQIRETGVFCVNIVEHAARAAMNQTSKAYARGTDEFAAAGVPKAECLVIDCPRVDGAPGRDPADRAGGDEGVERVVRQAVAGVGSVEHAAGFRSRGAGAPERRVRRGGSGSG